MSSHITHILLATIFIASMTHAQTKASREISVATPNETKSTVTVPRPNFDQYPVILDNSKFDLKQLLNPDIKKSENQRVFGPGSGGGGNICGLGIQQVTLDLLRYFQEIPEGKKPAYIEPLKQAIAAVKFLEGSGLMLRGQKVNAINYPQDKVIVLDEQACRTLAEDSTRGKIFLLHEYLGLANVEDTNYQLSSNIVNDLVRIRASEKKGGNFQVIPQTSIGRFALAWGITGQALDRERYSWDNDYRDWVETQFLVAYLVDTEEARILSVFYQDQDLPVINPRWDASLVSDGKNGLLILQHDRWTTEVAAAYFANSKTGKVSPVPVSTVVKLNQSLRHAGVDHALSSRKKQIPQMAIAIDSTKILVEDGAIKLRMEYYEPKSEDSYGLEIWASIQFDSSNWADGSQVQIVKTQKIKESWID